MALLSWPPTRRTANLAGALVAGGMLAYALYVQHGLGLEPCHLCVFQRVAVLALGSVLLAAAMHDPAHSGARVYGVLAAVMALAGVAVAGRHVWIQQQPAGSVPACGADLDFMFEVMPFQDVIVKVFKGGGECQKIDWTLLGLSMPAWVLIAVVLLGVWAVYANFRLSRADSR